MNKLTTAKPKYFRFWFPVFLYSVIILSVSSLPGGQTPALPKHFDKFIHLCEYIPFGFLVYRALINTSKGLFLHNTVLWVVIFTGLFGAGDEFHQNFIEGREASVADFLMDVIGGGIGAIVYQSLLKKGLLKKCQK